jgi:hypothetical protein
MQLVLLLSLTTATSARLAGAEQAGTTGTAMIVIRMRLRSKAADAIAVLDREASSNVLLRASTVKALISHRYCSIALQTVDRDATAHDIQYLTANSCSGAL